MGETKRKERFERLDGTHLLWASTMGASYDLGIMSKAMLIPSMKTVAQHLVRHQMQKNIFPFIEGKALNSDLYREIFDNLNDFIFFTMSYEVHGDDRGIILSIPIDECMYCPTGVGGPLLKTAICPYPQLFSVYLDMVIKNGFFYKAVKIVKQPDGSYIKREGEKDIMEFSLEDDIFFESVISSLLKGVKDIEEVFSNSIKEGIIKEEDLWDRNYIEIPNTNPRKYKTKFTEFAKKYIQPIEDKLLESNKKFVFAVLVDDNGYLPSHNTVYDKPLTGDYKKDLIGNRSMRIFDDFTGITAAKNQRKYILQPYPRDVGVLMYDVSAEIKLNGKHWGALRIGYKI